MLFQILATSALATLASAAFTPRPQYIDANYDDITVIPAAPELNTLKVYRGLNYTSFVTNQAGVGGAAQVAGVPPHTSPNNILSGIQSTAVTGENAGWRIATGSKYFDLKSFYYGCSVNTQEGADGLPQQCTINVRGYRQVGDTNPVASAQLSFTPKATQVLAPPVQAFFDKSFSLLQRVEIVQIESTSGEALNVIVLDDVAYNLYQ